MEETKTPNSFLPKKIIRRVEYRSADKGNIDKAIKETIPKELIPSKISLYIVGIIFALVFVFGIANFPLGKMMSGTLDVKFEIGWPWTFFVLDMGNPQEVPIKMAIFLDLLIYGIIAYAINVILNYVFRLPTFESKEKQDERLTSYQTPSTKRTSNLSDKITQKVFEKNSPAKQTQDLSQENSDE